MNHDITRDRKIEEDENYEGEYPELREILFPEQTSMLYSILNSLNYNIANFYAYMKFKDYISENSLDMELLQET